MKKSLSILTLVAVLFCTSAVAADKVVVIPLNSKLPQTNWINLSVYSAFLSSTAEFKKGSGAEAGIHLTGITGGAFGLSFILPPNYKKGTNVKAHILWHTSSVFCSIKINPDFLSVSRASRKTLALTPPLSSRLSFAGGNIISASVITPNYTREIQAIISSPESGTDLEPLDAVIFGIFRHGTSIDDTCTGDMVIKGVYITYETI